MLETCILHQCCDWLVGRPARPSAFASGRPQLLQARLRCRKFLLEQGLKVGRLERLRSGSRTRPGEGSWPPALMGASADLLLHLQLEAPPRGVAASRGRQRMPTGGHFRGRVSCRGRSVERWGCAAITSPISWAGKAGSLLSRCLLFDAYRAPDVERLLSGHPTIGIFEGTALGPQDADEDVHDMLEVVGTSLLRQHLLSEEGYHAILHIGGRRRRLKPI